jgi:pimeloyl-ACP methyl ester carboxylesterase
MPTFRAESLTLHYEQYGARANPLVLLVHGYTCQTIHWPRALIERIADAGYRVVAFDNRDAGLSIKLDHLDVGTIEGVLADWRSIEPPYRIADLGRDVIALMDHLGQSGAHLIGFSMGGIVAQQLALDQPERVFSITSIGSTTSDPDLPRADRDAFRAFVSTPPASREAAIAHLVNGWRALGGPHYDSRRVGLARFAEAAWDRGYSASGAARQLLALLHADPRGERLRTLDVPALIIHGGVDPMVPLACGERTAACLKNSRLTVFEQMGHDLPDPLLDRIADEIVSHLDSVPTER